MQSRRVVARRADVTSDADEPVLELARRKVALEGGSLKLALRELREERRQRARQIALAEAPSAVKLDPETYQRVSSDPRWPFGIEDEQSVAPFGLSECGLPRTQPASARNGPRKNELAARGEAREVIMQKLNRMGCDPIKIMAELAMDEDEKSEVRLRAAAELATMVYPRLRGVETIQREEKTIFVIGVPSEQPATTEAWLNMAEGPKRISQAVKEASEVIEGEIIDKGVSSS